MQFFQKAGDILLRTKAAAAQNKDALQRMTLHGINQGQQLYLRHLAKGRGDDPDMNQNLGFLQPYGVPAGTTIYNGTQSPPAAPPQPSGFGKGLLTTALLATGLGALGGGGYGVYSLVDSLKNQVPAQVKPPEVKPVNLDLKVSFEPDAGGLQVKPVEVPK